MVAIPILSGVSTSETGDFNISLPVNLEPVATDTKLSKGYLRTAMGAQTWGTTGPGKDRGGIVWNDALYRVMGSKLVRIDSMGGIAQLGDVGGDTPVALDYGFGRLAINSGDNLYYWDGASLIQVTDPDLGPVNDMIWMDGYFITTDGTSIVVTDLADPASVNPLKYGSAEADPDMITGLAKLQDRLVAFGSNTVEFYSDAGTNGFPFQVENGSTIHVGCVGRKAKIPFAQTIAFVGSGRNQGLGVWLIGSGSANKISTRVVDDYLAAETAPTDIQLETRSLRDENRLYVHLSNLTLVYCASASSKVGEAVWYICKSGLGMEQPYRVRNAVYAYGKWICGDLQSSVLGVISEGLQANDKTAFLSITQDGENFSQERSLAMGARGNRNALVEWRPHRRFSNYLGIRVRGTSGQPHFGAETGYQFDMGLIYNQTKGAILHGLELVGTPGRDGLGFASAEAELEGLGT